MNSRNFSADETERIARAVDAILGGGVVACPTEAVYGLSCLPRNRQALERLLDLKNRPAEKGFIIAAAAIEQLQGLVEVDSSPMIEEIRASWPGPVTWILPAHGEAPEWLTGASQDLAVRVSAHPILASLCEQCGPLVSTSANLSGAEPARSAGQVADYFPGQLDYILDGKLGDSDRPSEIRHGRDGSILRAG